MDQERAIVGVSGRRVKPSITVASSDRRHQGNYNSRKGQGLTPVDFVGHWWVWKTEWTSAMFALPSYNLWTGEDIEFCAKLKMLLGVQAITLNYPDADHRPENYDVSATLQGVASFKVSGTNEERIAVMQYWITQGWTPLEFE